MKSHIGIIAAIFLLFVLALVPDLHSFWTLDGVVVCNDSGGNAFPKMAPDGSGGAIIAWSDQRSGISIWAQRINPYGEALWTSNGVNIVDSLGMGVALRMASDGAGGAIIAWGWGTRGVRAQRVGANGAIKWAANGVEVDTVSTRPAMLPEIIADGYGGAIIAYLRNMIPTSMYDLYAQRIDSTGTRLWLAGGVPVCTLNTYQYYQELVSDGAGGAVITWMNGTNNIPVPPLTISAQRVASSGSVVWTADGITISAVGLCPEIVSDGTPGGSIIAWYEGTGIYAQRVSGYGGQLWTAGGVPIVSGTAQSCVGIVSDGSHGAIIAWSESRSTDFDIYVQRIDGYGNGTWSGGGVPLCTAVGDQGYPRIVPDGAGGAVVVWDDYRSYGLHEMYAQRVAVSGAPLWTVDGAFLPAQVASESFDTDFIPNSLISDGSGGAIVAWEDQRDIYASGDDDIYAQRIDRNGCWGYPRPYIDAVRDVPGDQGGFVYLSWQASRLDAWPDQLVAKYSVWRSIGSTKAALEIGEGTPTIGSLSELAPDAGGSVLWIERTSGRTYYWELVGYEDASSYEMYAMTVPTLFDSTATCTEFHYFKVAAHASDPKVSWTSQVDSCRSVDNLPPSAPLGLAAKQVHVPEGLRLSWKASPEKDISYYAIYRSESGGTGICGDAPLATTRDTMYLDTGWRWNRPYFYRLAAVDIHGNESSVSLLGPDDVTGDDTPGVPEATYLHQNVPNPFNPVTKIAFGLNEPAYVSLGIFDSAGRVVRVLVDGNRPAGRYEETWDGRTNNGRTVSSGVYFYRLTASPFSQTKKMVLLR